MEVIKPHRERDFLKSMPESLQTDCLQLQPRTLAKSIIEQVRKASQTEKGNIAENLIYGSMSSIEQTEVNL